MKQRHHGSVPQRLCCSSISIVLDFSGFVNDAAVKLFPPQRRFLCIFKSFERRQRAGKTNCPKTRANPSKCSQYKEEYKDKDKNKEEDKEEEEDKDKKEEEEEKDSVVCRRRFYQCGIADN